MLPLTRLFVEAWREAMKGWDVVKSQVFEEWTSQAHQQGVKDALLRFLRRMQATLPPDLEQAIRGIDDLGRLDSVLDIAFSSASIDDFRRATGL